MTTSEPDPTLGQTFTLSEAAEVCRRRDDDDRWTTVSRKTLQRRLEADAFPHAYRANGPAGEGSGPWLIPLADLLAEGLTPHPAEPNEPPVFVDLEQDPFDVRRIADLEHEVAEYRRRAEVAEAIAEERQRALADARLALRALTAGPASPTPVTVLPEPEVARIAPLLPVPAPEPSGAPESAGRLRAAWRALRR